MPVQVTTVLFVVAVLTGSRAFIVAALVLMVGALAL